VLFLDEPPEFDQRSLEVLRQPLEDKIVTISRAAGTLTFPANFQLVAAMNPCPCGYYGDPTKECSCAPSMVTRYQKRTSEAGPVVSGPLLDPLRVDIHIEVPRMPYEKLTSERLGEPSSTVAARVEAARERQRKRFASHDSRVVCNADMTPADVPVREACRLDTTGQSLMRSAMQQLQMSARAFHRVLKIAQTIADLAGNDEIALAHPSTSLRACPERSEGASLAEAISPSAGREGRNGNEHVYASCVLLGMPLRPSRCRPVEG